MNSTIIFQRSSAQLQLEVSHSYKRNIQTLWEAFTMTEILEKWWAPKPYKAVVIQNQFENGKSMFYYMLSPEGEKHYCSAEFSNIQPYISYEVIDAFTDEKAKINTSLPRMKWLK